MDEIIIADEQLPDRQSGLLSHEHSDELTQYLQHLCAWFDESFEQVAGPAGNMGIILPDACQIPFVPDNSSQVLRDARTQNSMQAMFDLDFMATQTNTPDERTRVLVALDAAVNIPLEKKKIQNPKVAENIAHWKDILLKQQVEIPLESVSFFLRQPALLERLLHAGAAFDAIHTKLNEIDTFIAEQLVFQTQEINEVSAAEERLLREAKQLQRKLLATDTDPMPTRKPNIAFGNMEGMRHAVYLTHLLEEEIQSQKAMSDMLESYHDRGAHADRFHLERSVVGRAQEDYQGVAALEAAMVELWGRFITNITSCMIKASGFYHSPKSSPGHGLATYDGG